MAKRLQQESGEERVTAKSKPMMNLSARMPSVVSLSTSLSPVKRCYGKQDPWRSVVADDRSGQPDRLSSTGYSKSDYDRAWSSQEWKSEVTGHDRSGKPDKTSWSMVQQVRPHHGETLLDGDAQCVRYGETLRDRSGRLGSVNYQEEAESETFVMGSDAAEFVNKVKDQVRKRQKRMSNVADSGEEHSIIWGMFMAATMNAATFMGKNFMDNQNSIIEFHGSHFEENVRHHIKIRERTRKRSTIWIKFIGKEIHGNSCHWLVTKLLSIFNAQKSTSSQILCCVLEGSINILNPTKLGRKGLNGL